MKLATTTLALTAALASPALADSTDLLQDLSLDATATTEAIATVFVSDLGFEDVREEQRDSASTSAFNTGTVRSEARAFAIFEEEGAGFTGFADAEASAQLTATRSENAVRFTGFAQTAGSFNRSPVGAGDAGTTLDYAYEFTALGAADYAFEVFGDVGSGSPLNEVAARLVRLDDGFVLADFSAPGTGTGPDFETVTVTGTLEAATSYRLTIRNAILGGRDEAGGFGSLTGDFTVTASATPIPSPAALPAGLALLGGLLTRRRH